MMLPLTPFHLFTFTGLQLGCNFCQEQAESRPKYSSAHLPPDAFALDASLAQARSGTNRQLGVGIGPSAERNREYLKELDRYLQVSV